MMSYHVVVCPLASTSSQQHVSKSIPQSSLSVVVSSIKNLISFPFCNRVASLSFFTAIFSTLVMARILSSERLYSVLMIFVRCFSES